MKSSAVVPISGPGGMGRSRLAAIGSIGMMALTLAGCVSGEGDALGLAELGEPGAKGVVAQGIDENGNPVELRAAVPQTRPGEAAGTNEASTSTVTALVPASKPGSGGTISGSAAIDRMIEAAAAENGVPRELAFAVVRVESHYNPRAKGAGVYGLSQIMPATARSLGFSGAAEELFDPATNLRYGMKYLKGAWEKGGRDICQASMKYKGGHRATTMTKSAAAYCANVKRHMAAITGRPSGGGAETQIAELAASKPKADAKKTSVKAPSVAALAAESKASSDVLANIAKPTDAAAALVAVEGSASVPVPSAATEMTAAGAQRGGRALHASASSEPDPSRFGE